MSPPIRKYPRTRHIEGSRLQPGDEDLDAVPWKDVRGKYLVLEEKVDGANCAVSFDEHGKLLLQSRGHYLMGGAREKHFNALKPWAQSHANDLRDVLRDRYVMYGEWLYAKHTVYYDALPHYFLEFDVLDRTTGSYLSTAGRRSLLEPIKGIVVSVPVLSEGKMDGSLDDVTAHVGPSRFKTASWRDSLASQAAAQSLDVERVMAETDASPEMEGLYIKVEDERRVLDRLKWVRPGFLTAVVDSGTHWLARPIIPNRLAHNATLDALFTK